MYAHYNKGMPLKPRSLLYPIFGEKIMKNSAFGTFVDVFSIICVAAGTIGPIGFLGLQAGYGVSTLTGIEESLTLYITIIVILVIGLIIGVLILGPAMFIFNNFFEALGLYVNEFVSLNTFRGDEAWLGGWTVFFFAWFIGYGPMMALFTSRISRGRTLRELVLAVAVIAPVVTTFWFTVVGGTGISQEINVPGSVSEALDAAGPPAAMMAITENLPLSSVFGVLFLIVTTVFVLTTTDSMSLTISMAISGD